MESANTNLPQVHRPSAFEDITRRVIDTMLAGLTLLALAIPMAGIALLVRLTSPGPVLFRQQRVGQGGRLFGLLKFRTMRTGASGPSVTAGSDTRITPVGKHLRHWKLDELPQFINVLLGEMSIVGPRPEVPGYVQFYTEDQRGVLDVLPGLTGPSQLLFRNEESLLMEPTDPESFYIETLLPMKLATDLYYVQRRRLSDDARVVLQTVGAIAGWRLPLDSLVLVRQEGI
jgi:lipopolysaccharide/colanic/teichoic acid biosynthesis glycosyltransferase